MGFDALLKRAVNGGDVDLGWFRAPASLSIDKALTALARLLVLSLDDVRECER